MWWLLLLLTLVFVDRMIKKWHWLLMLQPPQRSLQLSAGAASAVTCASLFPVWLHVEGREVLCCAPGVLTCLCERCAG